MVQLILGSSAIYDTASNGSNITRYFRDDHKVEALGCAGWYLAKKLVDFKNSFV